MLGTSVVYDGRAGLVIAVYGGEEIEVLTFAPGGGAPGAVRCLASEVTVVRTAPPPTLFVDPAAVAP